MLTSFDEDPTLTDVAVPSPGPQEVRVRVLASSVNPADWMTARGGFRSVYEHRLPAILGRDFAGVVDAIGSGVTRFDVGDEVFGFVKRDYVGDGTFADYVVIPEDQFAVPVPPSLSLDHAGALGLAGVTAVQCLDALGCDAGDTVLVNGATGGVGAFAIQLARRRGLHVIATATAGEADAHVRALGAETTVDWTAGDVGAQVHASCPDGVAGVVDLASKESASMTALAAAVLAPGRTSVSTLSAAPSSGQTAGARLLNIHSSGDPDLLTRVAEAADDGMVVPLVDAFPLERIDDAFAALARAPLGKLGLRVA